MGHRRLHNGLASTLNSQAYADRAMPRSQSDLDGAIADYTRTLELDPK